MLCRFQVFLSDANRHMGQRREVAERARVKFLRDAGLNPRFFQPVLENTGFSRITKGRHDGKRFLSFGQSRLRRSRLRKFRVTFGAPWGIVVILKSTFRAGFHDEAV